MEDVMRKIIEMVEDIQPYIEFSEETKLLEEDILDSVSVLLLVQEIEDEFDISIEIEEVNGKSFESIVSITEVIKVKLQNKISM